MREIAGCDFCGDPPTGTFDVLPAREDPDGDGKRMVLCGHCRDALASILDPLLDATAGDVEPDDEPTTRTAEPADTAPEGDIETAVSDAEPDTSDEPDADAEPGDGTTGETTATPETDDTDESNRVPSGYRKVVRFLDGRELPIPYADAVSMAAGAYDLDESQVDAILAAADSRDRLTTADGELRRG